VSPVDTDPLVVATRIQAKLDCRASDRQLLWQQIAASGISTETGDGVDLALAIAAVDQTVTPASAASTPDDDDVPVASSPLALHANEFRT